MKFNLVRTNQALPDSKALIGARALIFGCFEGFGGPDAQRAWRRFWGRMIKAEPGELITVEMAFPRNYRFHKRLFALLTIGFDAWEPGGEARMHKGLPIRKDFEQFREDITILAGFVDATYHVDGSVSLKAKSISYAAMDDAEFERVYSAIADVLLQQVLTRYAGRAELDDVVNRMAGLL